MLILLTILVTLISSLLVSYAYCKYKFTYWRTKGVPYKQPRFIFGNLLDIVFSNEPAAKYIGKEINKSNSDYYGFYGFTKPDPNLIKNILVKDFHVFSNRPLFSNKDVELVMSYSLFGIKNPEWKILRKQLSPAFSSGKIKMMMPLMLKCGETLESYVSNRSGKSVDMKEIAARYTIDVISSCAFGINANSFINENADFRKYGLKMFCNSFLTAIKKLSYVFAPSLVRIFKYPFFDLEAINFFRTVFLDVMNTRQKTQVKRNDFVDILIESKDQDEHSILNSDKDKVVAQAIMFFGAGFETTSSTIAFTLHELGINQNIQNRLRKEIIAEIEKNGGLTYEAVQDMKYLHMVISETLRKYPITPFILRECGEKYKVEDTGMIIDKGTPVLIPQHALQWNPKYFPDPEIFDPERFNENNIHNINNYVYLPFGNGPRMCIGERFAMLNAKLGIIFIIKNFQLDKDSDKEIKFSHNVLLQSKDGISMICKKI